MNFDEYSAKNNADIKKSISEDKVKRLDTLIGSGGDLRLKKTNKHLNKYFIAPVLYENVLNRGSCTCSPFTPEAFFSVCDLLSMVNDSNFETFKKRQTAQLKSLINEDNKDVFDIFYAPSGSDLCYFPLIFSKLLNPEKVICNLVTCPEELGSGSRFASQGKFYSGLNQFGNQIVTDTVVDPSLKIEKIDFPARNSEGLINDHRDLLSETINNKIDEGYSIICNLVIGSKSGIEDNLNIIPDFEDDILWVIDICQTRVKPSLINRLLEQSCCIMITGSKFYQAPPFCGAFLVPKTITQKLRLADATTIKPFGKVFTKYDFPESLENMRRVFPDYKNLGLLLRWHAAIYEMSQLSKFNYSQIYKVIKKWNATITAEFNKYGDRFSIMPDTNKTNKSIISFKLKDGNGNFLDFKDLWAIYASLSVADQTSLGKYKKLLLGQPVIYGDRSFLRVALGSYEIRQLLKENLDFSLDKEVINIIYSLSRDMY